MQDHPRMQEKEGNERIVVLMYFLVLSMAGVFTMLRLRYTQTSYSGPTVMVYITYILGTSAGLIRYIRTRTYSYT
jgi:hypothetical protein